MEHYLLAVGNVGHKSNFENSMVKRKKKCWGINGRFTGITAKINQQLISADEDKSLPNILRCSIPHNATRTDNKM